MAAEGPRGISGTVLPTSVNIAQYAIILFEGGFYDSSASSPVPYVCVMSIDGRELVA